MSTILIINTLNGSGSPENQFGPQFVSAGTGIASIILTTNSKEIVLDSYEGYVHFTAK
ncbi:MAG: hypothetical protein ABI651_06380 [Verrucomicrobiota bacterium]